MTNDPSSRKVETVKVLYESRDRYVTMNSLGVVTDSLDYHGHVSAHSFDPKLAHRDERDDSFSFN